MKLTKKAFSLVELLVAMAIIAVLISIAAYGIQIVQRNARDLKRKKIVEDLILTIHDIQTNHFMYPDNATKSESENSITFYIQGQEVAEYEVKGMDLQWFRAGTSGNECSDQGDFLSKRPSRDNVAIGMDFQNLLICARLEASELGGYGYVVSL
ncbi:prepilin-type N-terminal cleavage/methylation domain-containing protein [Candidatus Dojkabacteria bacterium]|nr:prepilin-type N-terminal cleavage/methylation domain-containing protein [Candidatus Dojkabacteria bacterium]